MVAMVVVMIVVKKQVVVMVVIKKQVILMAMVVVKKQVVVMIVNYQVHHHHQENIVDLLNVCFVIFGVFGAGYFFFGVLEMYPISTPCKICIFGVFIRL